MPDLAVLQDGPHLFMYTREGVSGERMMRWFWLNSSDSGVPADRTEAVVHIGDDALIVRDADNGMLIQGKLLKRQLFGALKNQLLKLITGPQYGRFALWPTQTEKPVRPSAINTVITSTPRMAFRVR